jgi:Zn finger protein HypA/HybF involved in hydrogenase expression
MDEIIGEMEITFPTDEDGYTGRQCPHGDCGRYFKVLFGTGIQADVPCICPYCGHEAPHDEFFTNEQIEYVNSMALNKVSGWLFGELKKLEMKPDPRAMFSIGVTVEGSPVPISYYSEKDLEQTVTCEKCDLHYAIYGAFGYCPDCGVHNSLQILNASLAAVQRLLALATDAESDVAKILTENALADAVASFDGFGREIASVHAAQASDPRAAEGLSFQNLESARAKVELLFGIRINDGFSDAEWAAVIKAFQKRHLLAHKMGVLDQRYLDVTGENGSFLGRRVQVAQEEVESLCAALARIGGTLASGLGVA